MTMMMNSNSITGVPATTTSTTRRIPPAAQSNRPSANTPSRNVSLALASNMPSANAPPRNMPPTVASNRPSANTPARNALTKTPPTSTTRTEPRKSNILAPTAILRLTYANAVLVEDVKEVEEASKEEEIEPPAVLLLKQPLICTGKRTRTKPKSYVVGHRDVPKYQYGHTHLQIGPKMRSVPRKFEFGSIHLQTAGIVNDMYALAAASSDTGDLLPMTKEDRDVYIMGVIMTQYSLKKGLKEFGERMEEAVVKSSAASRTWIPSSLWAWRHSQRNNKSRLFLLSFSCSKGET